MTSQVSNSSDAILRDELRFLLLGGNAHMSLDDAVKDFPIGRINTHPPNVAYTPWQLLEHIRRTQHDVLEFIKSPRYVTLQWPDSYWPERNEQADEAAWQQTLAGFHEDTAMLIAITQNTELDLYTPLEQGSGQNILRELQLVADHNAYHIGEFAILRQVMQTWGPEHIE
jgi:Protein of unknown function (DUF664).